MKPNSQKVSYFALDLCNVIDTSKGFPVHHFRIKSGCSFQTNKPISFSTFLANITAAQSNSYFKR